LLASIYCIYTLIRVRLDPSAGPPTSDGELAEYCYITPGTCIVKVTDVLTDKVVAPTNRALSTVVAGWEAGKLQPFKMP